MEDDINFPKKIKRNDGSTNRSNDDYADKPALARKVSSSSVVYGYDDSEDSDDEMVEKELVQGNFDEQEITDLRSVFQHQKKNTRFDPWFKEAIIKVQEDVAEKVKILRGPTYVSQGIDEYNKMIARTSALQKRRTGPEREKMFLKWVDTICAGVKPKPLILSPDQQNFKREILRAAIPLMYRDDLEIHLDRILVSNGWSSIKQLLLITCPRQWGKTTIITILSLALTLVIEQLESAIFSTGKRISAIIIARIFKLVCGVEEAYNRLRKHNAETLSFTGDTFSHGDDLRTISSYPSKIDTVRGITCRFIFYDEFQIAIPRFFFEVVVPLLELTGCVFVGLSTVKDPGNYGEKLKTIMDVNEKETMFNVIEVTDVCAACTANKLDKYCKHMLNNKPSWKPAAQTAMVEKIYTANNDQDTMMQEIRGKSSGGKNRAFPEHLITRFFERPRYCLRDFISDFPSEIFLLVDPNGGASDMALASGYYNEDNLFVVSVCVCVCYIRA
jgi:hypothetical protein